MDVPVIAHPNSKHPRVEEDMTHVYHVYVSGPPLEGKANEAIAKALAKYLGVKRSHLYLVRGEHDKNKVFELI